MKNPFVSFSQIDQREYLTSRCSLNRAVLKKLPLRGIDDSIEGKRFKDIFSTPLVAEEVRAVSRRYEIDLGDTPEGELPKLVDEWLMSNNALKKQMAERVAKKFGLRLGLILLTLKKGERENRLARDDWDDECWEFWRDLETVILPGGLASGMLGRRFKEYIHYVFDIAGERCYDIRLFDNGSYIGMMGLAQRLVQDGEAALVLDLGHTRFKRGAARMADGEIAEFLPMDSRPSMYTADRFTNDRERFEAAMELHRHIVRTIESSWRAASRHFDLSDTILVSIANYVNGGVLNSVRGGFAKLSVLAENYAQLLEEELSSELHCDLRVKLVHDSTASALYFDGVDNAVCITLGTAFGVGFPNIKI